MSYTERIHEERRESRAVQGGRGQSEVSVMSEGMGGERRREAEPAQLTLLQHLSGCLRTDECIVQGRSSPVGNLTRGFNTTLIIHPGFKKH